MAIPRVFVRQAASMVSEQSVLRSNKLYVYEDYFLKNTV